jgi:BASS family bile acid:Na+ symporter
MNLQHMTMLALQASILLTVFGFGLQTTARDLVDLVRRPALASRSLLAMFLVMPLIAVALVTAFELRPSVKIALVALSISPIPPLLPGRESKAGGHSSFAIGLMAIAGLLSIVIVPIGVLILGAYLGRPFQMPSGAIARAVLMMAILPLAVGMVFRAIFPVEAGAIAVPVARVAQALLAAGALVILAATLPAVITLVGNGTVAALSAFVAAGLAVGHLLGGSRPADQVVLALSTACRHPMIALAVARANFPDEPLLGATVLLYLLLGLLIGLPYIAWQRRRIQEHVSPA